MLFSPVVIVLVAISIVGTTAIPFGDAHYLDRAVALELSFNMIAVLTRDSIKRYMLVLTFDAFNETIEKAEKTKKERIEQLRENQKRIERTISTMLKLIMGYVNTVEIHAPNHEL
jgi:hypothetical protein